MLIFTQVYREQVIKTSRAIRRIQVPLKTALKRPTLSVYWEMWRTRVIGSTHVPMVHKVTLWWSNGRYLKTVF